MGIKYIEALAGIFLNLMQIQPRENFYTTSLAVAITILEVDQMKGGHEENKRYLKELYEIKEKTHPSLDLPLAKAEAMIASTDMREWGKSIGDTKNNRGERIVLPKKTEVNYFDIYQLLKESYYTVLKSVSVVVSGYSLDIKFRFGEAGGSPSWLDKGVE